MSTGPGQMTGDVYSWHAYAHPATRTASACWSVYFHGTKLADGTASGIAGARRAAAAKLSEFGGVR
nr:hypothetical protein [Propionibacterium sp.]